jgi:hypothetical protein
MADAATMSKARLATPPLGTFILDDGLDRSSSAFTIDMALSHYMEGRVAFGLGFQTVLS